MSEQAVRPALRVALPATINAGRPPPLPVSTLEGETMGTIWRVLAVAPASNLDMLQSAVEARLRRLVGEMSHWEPTSVLARFNASPPGSWTTLPRDFARVIDAALRIAGASNGAFDPAMGALVNLWGYGPSGPAPVPNSVSIAALRRAGSWRDLRWDPAAGRLQQPGGLQLDLSAIAKGHAADAIADVLLSHGIDHGLVEVGGELVGLGMRPDGDPWWVDLEAPPAADLPPLRVALHGLAVATSGDYVRGAHTLDPGTGSPAAHGVSAVSVIATSAMVADAWATALTAVDLAQRTALCADYCLAARIIVRTPTGWIEHLSPALSAMMVD